MNYIKKCSDRQTLLSNSSLKVTYIISRYPFIFLQKPLFKFFHSNTKIKKKTHRRLTVNMLTFALFGLFFLVFKAFRFHMLTVSGFN